MKHLPTNYLYLAQSLRRGRNGKGYWVLYLRGPVCGREVRPLANAWRGRGLNCAGY